MQRFNTVVGIGDVHARPQAVRALLSKLEKHLGAAQFASTALVFLGDYVDRGPDARGTLDLLIDLKASRPAGSTFFIAGNHDLAASLFVGDYPDLGTTMQNFRPYKPFELEGLWPYADKNRATIQPDAVNRVHLQARRWAGVIQDPYCAAFMCETFQSGATFESYGTEFASRDELVAAMPAHHKEFLRDLPWYHQMPHPNGRQTLFFVHAGLRPTVPFEEQVRSLQERDITQPWAEWLAGRTGRHGTVDHAPPDFPLNYIQVNGHHGFLEVDMEQRRVICDDGGGHPGSGLAACVFQANRDDVEIVTVEPEEWEASEGGEDA